MPLNISSTGSAFMISSKSHGDAIEAFAISVRYDINDLEPLAFIERLYELNGPDSHEPGAAVASNGIEALVEEKTSDALSMKITANHSPRERGDLVVVHGPTAARSDCSRLLDDVVGA